MEYTSFIEALKGNQHKLDKNKNGKLDADDFKLLRKEEELDEKEKNKIKEDLKGLDEKSDQAKKNKTMKNVMDASRGARFKNTPGTSAPDPEPQHKTARAHNVAIGRAIRQMSNEEQTPPFDGGTVTQPAKKNSDGTTQNPMSRARELAKQAMKKKMKEEFDIDMSDEQLDSILECMDEEIELEEAKTLKDIAAAAETRAGSVMKPKATRTQSSTNKTLSAIRAGAENRKMKEEIELEENHLNDFRRYTQAAKNAKAKGDHNIARDAEQKASKSAANYTRVTGKKPTHNEEVELDESHFKLGDKVKCKSSGMVGKVVKLDEPDGPDDKKYYTIKHENGKTMKHAPNDLTMVKEDVKIAFKDFMMVLEYDAQGGVYRHKGSYGSSYQGDDDEDAPKKKPAAPAEKRGRGRPAGAKSGAGKITSTSKLYK